MDVARESGGAWVNLCRPVEEDKIGVRDLSDIKRSLHIKISRRLLLKDNLWNAFFRAKYIKGDHLICTPPNTKVSIF